MPGLSQGDWEMSRGQFGWLLYDKGWPRPEKSIYSFFMDPLWGEMSITHVAKRELELV